MKCPFLSTLSTAFVRNHGVSLVKQYGEICPVMSRMIRNLSTPSTTPASTIEDAKSRCPFLQEGDNIIKQASAEVQEDVVEIAPEQGNRPASSNEQILRKQIGHSTKIFKKVSRMASKIPLANNYSNDQKEVVIWSSMDSLGMSSEPKVKDAYETAQKKFGAGAGGTRNISGNTIHHEALEAKLAEIHQQEAALLMTSGYVANHSTLYTLAKILPGCHIFTDEANHASIMEGIRDCGAPSHIYRHNDVGHLEKLLSELHPSIPKIVAFETVNSMFTNICPLEALCEVGHKYGAFVYANESNAMGVYGKNGSGISEMAVCHKPDLIAGSLGQSIGLMGGYISGSRLAIDMVRSYASGFIFTTSLPPTVLKGALASVELLSSDEGSKLREKQREAIQYLWTSLLDAGFPVEKCSSHMIRINVGKDPLGTVLADTLLKKHGHCVDVINDSLDNGQKLLLIPTPYHTSTIIDKFVTDLSIAWKDMAFRLRNQDVIKDWKNTWQIAARGERLLELFCSAISKPPSETALNGANLFEYESFFESMVNRKKSDHSYRVFKKVARNADQFPRAKEYTGQEKDILVWCSNDYLGISRHKLVETAVINGLRAYGAGSGGSRPTSGNSIHHEMLEQKLASIHKKDSALLFTSCYVANHSTLHTLAKALPGCEIFSDEGNHASMIQGIRDSGVPKHIFRHNCPEDLEKLLQKADPLVPKIVAFETVHSMTGAVCPLEQLCDIAHKYNAITFIDEVHAVGLYGESGAGIGDRDGVQHKMDIISGTLGKAYGNIGGYIAADLSIVRLIRDFSNGFKHTTSLPPPIVLGALAAVELLSSEEGAKLRARHKLSVNYLRSSLMDAGLPVEHCPSHIIPIHVGNPQLSSKVSDVLMNEYGHYAQAINYPTVARGSEKLRIAPTPEHTPLMMDQFVNDISCAWKHVGLPIRNSKCTDQCIFCKKPLMFEAMQARENCDKPYCPQLIQCY